MKNLMTIEELQCHAMNTIGSGDELAFLETEEGKNLRVDAVDVELGIVKVRPYEGDYEGDYGVTMSLKRLEGIGVYDSKTKLFKVSYDWKSKRKEVYTDVQVINGKKYVYTEDSNGVGSIKPYDTKEGDIVQVSDLTPGDTIEVTLTVHEYWVSMGRIPVGVSGEINLDVTEVKLVKKCNA